VNPLCISYILNSTILNEFQFYYINWLTVKSPICPIFQKLSLRPNYGPGQLQHLQVQTLWSVQQLQPLPVKYYMLTAAPLILTSRLSRIIHIQYVCIW
jgi:hypothetical protein